MQKYIGRSTQKEKGGRCDKNVAKKPVLGRNTPILGTKIGVFGKKGRILGTKITSFFRKIPSNRPSK